MQWRARAKRLIPPSGLNSLLLRFPSLYRASLINYESNMDHQALLDLEECLNEAAGVPGDLIECGCSRCGTTAILAF